MLLRQFRQGNKNKHKAPPFIEGHGQVASDGHGLAVLEAAMTPVKARIGAPEPERLSSNTHVVYALHVACSHRVLRAHLFMADIFAGLEQEQFWNQRACLNAGASLEYRLTMAAC